MVLGSCSSVGKGREVLAGGSGVGLSLADVGVLFGLFFSGVEGLWGFGLSVCGSICSDFVVGVVLGIF